MTLEDDLEKIIGDIWYVKGRFDFFSKHEGLLERAISVKEILNAVARCNRGKKKFSEQLVLDNYKGSLQRFLMGDDLSSIHLSSKAMEVAFLMKIATPTLEEKQKQRYNTFEGLRSMAIGRKLIKTQESVDASRRVIDRRNQSMHDAILKQSVEIEQMKWFNRLLTRIDEKYRGMFTSVFYSLIKDRVKQWESLPDFSWYVTKKSDNAARKMIKDFFSILDQKIEEFTTFPDKNLIARLGQLPRKIQDAKQSVSRGEADFIKYCARENMKDVKVILDEIYEGKLFT